MCTGNKTLFCHAILFLCLFSVTPSHSLNKEGYLAILKSNASLTSNELLSSCKASSPYIRSISQNLPNMQYTFLDSISSKYSLTADELSLLGRNSFVVSQRLCFSTFSHALQDIYDKDLPVFIATDLVLFALHQSYENLLMEIEMSTFIPEITTIITTMYDSLQVLADSYPDNTEMASVLQDVDLYITMAKSLIQGTKANPRLATTQGFDDLWEKCLQKEMVSIPLFSSHPRNIDFSQFTVRGHYTFTSALSNYFKLMMWLGRIDFWLTPPSAGEEKWEPSELQRMAAGACLVNELIDRADTRSALNAIESSLTLIIGECDNLTPAELKEITDTSGIENAAALFNPDNYATFLKNLINDPRSDQQILSDFIILNPFDTTPDTLPISFKLLGQRFAIDSYILSNVVYNRVETYRMMPSPLDAMYVLGNNDGALLLEAELKKYGYSPQLASLRALVDGYPASYWEESVFTLWLQAIRLLGPTLFMATTTPLQQVPLFMKTSSWHCEKLNTQLSSWAHLRHDNILYAKQSYTAGTSCSFPHSYVEPYPDFYRHITAFSKKASAAFRDNYNARGYFERLGEVTAQLADLAQKELDHKPFTSTESDFLKKMLFAVTHESGTPPFDGWFADLFYDCWEFFESAYTIADVHTQPTDGGGAIVGKVLHVGTGDINLGIVVAPSPTDSFRDMAFIGPFLSYYETITDDFTRLTDKDWRSLVASDSCPPRPDWTNCYLADVSGNAMADGRWLDGIDLTVGTMACPFRSIHEPAISVTRGIGRTVVSVSGSSVFAEALYLINNRGQVVRKMDRQPATDGKDAPHRWEIGGLSPGCYIIRIVGKGMNRMRKVIVH